MFSFVCRAIFVCVVGGWVYRVGFSKCVVGSISTESVSLVSNFLSSFYSFGLTPFVLCVWVVFLLDGGGYRWTRSSSLTVQTMAGWARRC